MSAFEMMFLRGLSGVAIRIRLQVARDVRLFFVVSAWTFAVVLIPLAEVVALEFTTPTRVVLLATTLHEERLNLNRVVAVAAVGNTPHDERLEPFVLVGPQSYSEATTT